VYGVLCSCTGPQSAVLGQTGQVATSWGTYVNAHGGINGHPVKVIVKDDGQNPATALQNAKSLVEQDHAIALQDDSLVGASVATYVAGAGVPVVGGATPQPSFANPDWFPSASTLLPLIYGTVAEAKGKKNLGVMYCAESPVCAQLVPLTQVIGKQLGIKITPQKISGTAPNYTAPCLAMKDGGVDALYIADNGPVIQRVLASCSQQSFHPLNVGQASTTTNTLLKDPNTHGGAYAGTNANPYDSSNANVKAFQDANPGLITTPNFSYDAFYPWTGGLLFEAAVKAGKLTPSSTPAELKKALYSLHGETLGGVAPPLSFTPGKPAFIPCWFTYTNTGGTLVSANSNKPTCLSAAEAQAFAKAVGG
jgi:branched-chain amino acid transport system substrate-binding protein